MSSQPKQDKLIINIQFCKNCKTHNWCTHHSQNRYQEVFIKLKQVLNRQFPNVIVKANQLPKNFVPIKASENKFFDALKNKYVFFPSIGAFQVSINDQLIFSKKAINSWPIIQDIVDQISLKINGKVKQKTIVENDNITQQETIALANSYLSKVDNRKTFHKNDRDAFTLSEHFKLYQKGKPTEGSAKDYYAQIQKVNYKKLKRNYPNQDLSQNNQSIKQSRSRVKDNQLIKKLQSIQQQNFSQQLKKLTKGPQQGNIQDWNRYLDQLQNKFNKFQQKVSKIQKQNIIKYKISPTIDQNYKNLYKSRNKQQKSLSPIKKAQQKLDEKIHQVNQSYKTFFFDKEKMKKFAKIQQFLHASEQQKNKVLQKIYGSNIEKLPSSFKRKIYKKKKKSPYRYSQDPKHEPQQNHLTESQEDSSDQSSNHFEEQDQQQQQESENTHSMPKGIKFKCRPKYKFQGIQKSKSTNTLAQNNLMKKINLKRKEHQQKLSYQVPNKEKYDRSGLKSQQVLRRNVIKQRQRRSNHIQKTRNQAQSFQNKHSKKNQNSYQSNHKYDKYEQILNIKPKNNQGDKTTKKSPINHQYSLNQIRYNQKSNKYSLNRNQQNRYNKSSKKNKLKLIQKDLSSSQNQFDHHSIHKKNKNYNKENNHQKKELLGSKSYDNVQLKDEIKKNKNFRMRKTEDFFNKNKKNKKKINYQNQLNYTQNYKNQDSNEDSKSNKSKSKDKNKLNKKYHNQIDEQDDNKYKVKILTPKKQIKPKKGNNSRVVFDQQDYSPSNLKSPNQSQKIELSFSSQQQFKMCNKYSKRKSSQNMENQNTQKSKKQTIKKQKLKNQIQKVKLQQQEQEEEDSSQFSEQNKLNNQNGLSFQQDSDRIDNHKKKQKFNRNITYDNKVKKQKMNFSKPPKSNKNQKERMFYTNNFQQSRQQNDTQQQLSKQQRQYVQYQTDDNFYQNQNNTQNKQLKYKSKNQKLNLKQKQKQSKLSDFSLNNQNLLAQKAIGNQKQWKNSQRQHKIKQKKLNNNKSDSSFADKEQSSQIKNKKQFSKKDKQKSKEKSQNKIKKRNLKQKSSQKENNLNKQKNKKNKQKDDKKSILKRSSNSGSNSQFSNASNKKTNLHKDDGIHQDQSQQQQNSNGNNPSINSQMRNTQLSNKSSNKNVSFIQQNQNKLAKQIKQSHLDNQKTKRKDKSKRSQNEKQNQNSKSKQDQQVSEEKLKKEIQKQKLSQQQQQQNNKLIFEQRSYINQNNSQQQFRKNTSRYKSEFLQNKSNTSKFKINLLSERKSVIPEKQKEKKMKSKNYTINSRKDKKNQSYISRYSQLREQEDQQKPFVNTPDMVKKIYEEKLSSKPSNLSLKNKKKKNRSQSAKNSTGKNSAHNEDIQQKMNKTSNFNQRSSQSIHSKEKSSNKNFLSPKQIPLSKTNSNNKVSKFKPNNNRNTLQHEFSQIDQKSVRSNKSKNKKQKSKSKRKNKKQNKNFQKTGKSNSFVSSSKDIRKSKNYKSQKKIQQKKKNKKSRKNKKSLREYALDENQNPIDNVGTDRAQKSKKKHVKMISIGIQKDQYQTKQIQTDERYFKTQQVFQQLNHTNKLKSKSKCSSKAKSFIKQNLYTQEDKQNIQKNSDSKIYEQGISQRALILKQIYGKEFQKQKQKYLQVLNNCIPFETNQIQKQLKQEGLIYIPISDIDQFQRAQLFNKKGIKANQVKSNSDFSSNFRKVIKMLASRNQFLIIRLFENINETQRGFFGVWICDHYHWRCIIVNQLIPVDQQNNPIYCYHEQSQLWPLILQKALAMVVGGYYKLGQTPTNQIFHMLTGSNFINFRVREDYSKNQRFLTFLSQNEKKSFIIHAEKQSNCLQQYQIAQKQTKIYYILSQKVINDGQILLRMKEENKQPFLIKLQKFACQFKNIEILQLRSNHNFTSMSVPQSASTSNVNIFELLFEQAQFGSITLSKDQPSCLKTYLYKEQQQNVLRMVGQAKQKNKRQVFFDCYFQQGKYYLFVQGDKCNSLLSYFGEGTPSLTLKQKVNQEGLKNDFTQYVPLNNITASKIGKDSMPKFISLNNSNNMMSTHMTNQGGSRIKFSSMNGNKSKYNREQALQDLRLHFVQFLLGNRN